MDNISKVQKAVKFAIKTHEVYQKQTRKGKDISYITHPLTVGLILSEVNADTDVVCAGILHDTIEDSISERKVTYEMLEEKFGERVAKMVLSVSENGEEPSWEARKKEALEHISNFSNDSLFLKSADVISNVSEIIDDYQKDGDDVFKRFGSPEPKKENTIRNYTNVMQSISDKWEENPLQEKLKFLIKELEKLKN